MIDRSDEVFLGDSVLRDALSRLNDVVLITDAEPIDLPGPRIIYVNAAFKRMTGYSAAEAIGYTPRILQGPRTSKTELRRIRDALAAWLPVRVCLTNYRKNRVPFDVEFEIVPVVNEIGRYTHWVSVQRDVTDRTLADGVIRTATTPEALLDGASSEVILFTGAKGAPVCTRASADDPWGTRFVSAAGAVAPDALSGTIARVLSTNHDSPLPVVAQGAAGCVVRGLRVPVAVRGDLVLVVWRAETGNGVLADALLPAVVPRIATACERLGVQRDRTRLQGSWCRPRRSRPSGASPAVSRTIATICSP